MPFAMSSFASTEGSAFNWDVYEPVTKTGTIDICDSTSAGSSDGESLDSPSYAGSEELAGNSAVAMMWMMGAMNYMPSQDVCEEPVSATKNSKPRRQRGARRSKPVHTQSASLSILPPAFSPPPGLPLPAGALAPPPGLGLHPSPPGLGPPGLGAPMHFASNSNPISDIKEREGPFEPKIFRKELVATLRELSTLRNVARAVWRVRMQRVPRAHQASEFADLLTRAAEEPRGAIRRLWWAFAAGLGAGVDAPDGSAFGMAQCTAGLELFFQDSYPNLCEEIPRLPVATKSELMPTLRSIFPKDVLEAVLPRALC